MHAVQGSNVAVASGVGSILPICSLFARNKKKIALAHGMNGNDVHLAVGACY